MDEILKVSITDYVHLKSMLGRYTAYCINYNDFGEIRSCYCRYNEFYSFDRRLCSAGNSYSPEALSVSKDSSCRGTLSKLTLGSITNVVNVRATDVPLPPKKIFYRFNDDFLETRMVQLNSYLKSAVCQVANGDLYGHVCTLGNFLKVSDNCLPYMLFVNSRNDNIKSVDYSISRLQNFWKERGKVEYRAAHLSVINRFDNILENFDGEIASKVFLCILYVLHNSDESLKRKYANKFLGRCFQFKIHDPIVDVMDLSVITGFLASQCAICILNNGYDKKIPPENVGNNYSLVLMWKYEDYQHFFRNEDDLFEFYQQLVGTKMPEAIVAAGISSAYLLANGWFSKQAASKSNDLVAAAYEALAVDKIEIQFASFIYNIFSGLLFDNLKQIIHSPYRNLSLSLILKRLEMDYAYNFTENGGFLVSSEILDETGNSKEFENIIISGTVTEVSRVMELAVKGIEMFRWNSAFKILLSNLVYSVYPLSSWTTQLTPRDSMEAQAITTASKILLLSPWPIIGASDHYSNKSDNGNKSEVECNYDPFWINLVALHSSSYGKSDDIKSLDFFDEKITPFTNPVDRMPDCWYSVSTAREIDVKEEMDFKKSFPSLNITAQVLQSRLCIYSTVYESILDYISKCFHYFEDLDLSLTNHLKGTDSVAGYLSGIGIGNQFVEKLYLLLNENRFYGTNTSLFEQCATLLNCLIEYKMTLSQIEIAIDKVLMVYSMGKDMLYKFVEISETCKKFLNSLTEIIPQITSHELFEIMHEKKEIENKAVEYKSILTKTLKSLLDKTNELARVRNMLKVIKTQISHAKSFLERAPKSTSQPAMNTSFQDALDELEKERDKLKQNDETLEDQIMKGEEEVEKLRIKSSSYTERKMELEEEIAKLRSQQCDVRLLGFIRSIAVETRLRECLAMPYKLNYIKQRIEQSLQGLSESVKDEIEQRGLLNDLLKKFIYLSKDFYKSLNKEGDGEGTIDDEILLRSKNRNGGHDKDYANSYSYYGSEVHYNPKGINCRGKSEIAVLPEHDHYTSHCDMRY
ncbi:hypothetical protein BmR1_04g05225 [Babesia microti strain RI]|uniref:PX domain-containing protein n=1 Tax=Babesia microti (strain RI) TaxID=1133968 RepID=I7J887_BABMR|nr:hypothetical protein BmR1_04g05225 [Babesia microti strain RI]CCF75243.1 hypothetical protein BmR1_04g05225 [Babesia microti strain RI]|eukprot:XP_012649651.1 hypothetical protein BmR1_04g05225 [Babesia microti strain RI]